MKSRQQQQQRQQQIPLFEQPKVEDCLLLQNGKNYPENGCPQLAKQGKLYSSCPHGLDSFVCGYSTKK